MPADKRRRSACRKLGRIVLEQGGRCYWCGCEIVHRASLMDWIVADESGESVTYFIGEREHQAAIATVDHLLPMRKGGGNERHNLVAACGTCNRNRTRTPTSRNKRLCRKCGRQKRNRIHRKCHVCRIGSNHPNHNGGARTFLGPLLHEALNGKLD